VADLDDVIAVAGGACVVAAVHASSARAVGAVLLVTLVAGLLAGGTGWLLFERAQSDAERTVFVLGAIALVGGAAEYLRSSPLLAGVVAGIVWKRSPGAADHIIRADVGRFQHPLVILLLVIAGALVQFSAVALWLLGPFVVFRLAGKVIGAWLGSRLLEGGTAAMLAAYLLPPGLLGIAISLNVVQASASPAATAVLSAVALGTLVSELLALVVVPAGATE
jgi:Kef-type K+ transport system membrane component KefB